MDAEIDPAPTFLPYSCCARCCCPVLMILFLSCDAQACDPMGEAGCLQTHIHELFNVSELS